MSKLTIKLKKKEHPYQNEPSSSFELWGEFLLCYGDKILVDVQWDMTDFIKWFVENKEYLRTEKFPFDFTNSIAESRDILFEKIDDFSDSQEQEMFDYVDDLSDYFANHYFHLRGTDTYSYYIGLVPNSCGEISNCIDDEYHSFLFDMDEFLMEVDEEIKAFLSTIRIKQENKSFFSDQLSEYAPYLIAND